MNGFMKWMNESFTPKVNKITSNAWVQSIQDALMGILPLILVGSLMTMISLLKMVIPAIPDFTQISNFSSGLMSLFIAFLIPYFVMQHKKYRDKAIVSGTVGVALYLMLISPSFSTDGATISFTFERFGGVGMFGAIIAGLVAGIIMNLFSKFTFFKDNDTLPDFIMLWFDSLIPVTLILLLGWLFVFEMHVDVFAVINNLFKPLSTASNSFVGFILITFLTAFLYSLGISAWVLYPITYPVWMAGIDHNAKLAAAGKLPQYINTFETNTAWIWLGGTGATLTLVLMMVFLAKSKRLKVIGSTVLVPSIFNINEPVVYGAPVAFNPILMIPFGLNAIVLPAITWLALNFHMVAIPAKMNQMWYFPIGIFTYISNTDWRGLILLAVNLVASALIYYPFFKVYDNKLYAKEQAKAQAKKNK